MIKFLILYFANLVLDYPLQDEFLKKYKSESDYILFVHCAIWSIGLSIVLMYLGMFSWWKLVMLVVGHFLIDRWKCRQHYKIWPRRRVPDAFFNYRKEPIISDMMSLYIDQFLHVVQLIICFI